MKNSIALFFSSVFLILNSCQSAKTEKIYEVYKISENVIKVDGILEKSEWVGASVETDFRFPWLDTAAPFTEFRALYSDSTLYFAFQVNDTDIVINDNFETELDILPEDRVEIFVAQDRDLKEYYGFEIDPLGRVLDYSASYYRQYKRDWTCAEMKTAATITETGYIVEGSLPMKIIRNIADANILHAGIFRGEFHYGDNSDIIQHWISWVDPGTEIPDFHVPTAFGAFKFIESR